jgi:hypothetical protein
MRLRAAAGALFPLAGEEKKSKIEAERHRLHSVAPAGRARQRPQPALKQRTGTRVRRSAPACRGFGVCAWLEQVLLELVAGFDSELAERLA